MTQEYQLADYHLQEDEDGDVRARYGGENLVTELPEGIQVRGALVLNDGNRRREFLSDRPSSCTNLTALPKGLKVGGSLDLSGCTGITAKD